METIAFEAALSVIGGFRQIVGDLGIEAHTCNLVIKVISQTDLAREHVRKAGQRVPDEGLYYYHSGGGVTELLEPAAPGHDLAKTLLGHQRVDTMSHVFWIVMKPGNGWEICVLVPKKPNGMGSHIRQVVVEAERALEKELRQ